MIYEMEEIHGLDNYLEVFEDMQRYFRVAIDMAKESWQMMKESDFNYAKKMYLDCIEDILEAFRDASLTTLDSNTNAESVTEALAENLRKLLIEEWKEFSNEK